MERVQRSRFAIGFAGKVARYKTHRLCEIGHVPALHSETTRVLVYQTSVCWYLYEILQNDTS